MKHLSILGSTGSIGTQALEVISAHPEEFSVLAIGCNSNTEKLKEQILKFKPKYAAVSDKTAGENLKKSVGAGLVPARHINTKILSGINAISEIAALPDCDTILVSMVGASAIIPTIHAIRAHKNICLATKEVMVSAGDFVNSEIKKNNVQLIPVDSEHSAIFQCLHAGRHQEIHHLLLTCSGGPFLNKTRAELARVTIKDALNHPNWSMGKKITIDSATLMNKGLEFIEAQKLFNIAPDKIKVVIHPQSIIHSMVEFIDGSIIAQLGPKDMRLPIRYALSYPKRLDNHFPYLDIFSIGNLNFQEPDVAAFPCLKLAIESAKEGQTMPAVLNAANEIAVDAFLKNQIKFLQIPEIVEKVLNSYQNKPADSLENILEADSWARQKASQLICQESL